MKNRNYILSFLTCMIILLVMILSCGGEDEIISSPDLPATGLAGAWIEVEPMVLREAFVFQADSSYFKLWGGFDTAATNLSATEGIFSFANDSLTLDSDGLVVRDCAALTDNASRLELSSGSALQTFLRSTVATSMRGSLSGQYFSTFRVAVPGEYDFTVGQQWMKNLVFEMDGNKLMVSFNVPSVGVLAPTEVHLWDPGDGVYNGYKFAALGALLGSAPDIGPKTALLTGSILPTSVTAALKFVIYRGSTETFNCIVTGTRLAAN
ncbi:MAG: hypothetical protein KAT79_04150 [candidate division Zixibacteria bacterium]|nr:hypothetical protein [candidate division Zixibacteria bacterium]